MNITYFLSGISDEGDQVVDVNLTAERAAQILLEEVQSGRVTIVNSTTMNVTNVEKYQYPGVKFELKGSSEIQSIKFGKIKKIEPKKRHQQCGKCGNPGHQARTCGRDPIVKVKKGPIRITDSAAPIVEQKERKILSKEDYAALMLSMEDKEFMSGNWAMVNKLSPREVNKAVRSLNYQDYIDNLE